MTFCTKLTTILSKCLGLKRNNQVQWVLSRFKIYRMDVPFTSRESKLIEEDVVQRFKSLKGL